eukprot:TRINITY_DN876_c0_g1_i12.p1 TRINITY_DN876_c0_g1~~TRINITY_DN876_c0_g1_i12.p1  ORF type:complete len:312 (-),score=57.35 TRINITY_DN876_c0_g1_i12:226-1161(-)
MWTMTTSCASALSNLGRPLTRQCATGCACPAPAPRRCVSAVRKLREHLAYVEELRSLGFDELTISMTTNTVASASVTSSMCSVASVAVDGVPSVSATPGSSTTAIANKAPSSESPSGTPIPRRCDSDDTSSPFEIDFTSLTLETRIGEGSYADVWKGRWLDSPVAIKVLKTRFNGANLAVNRQPPEVAAAHATGGGWASISSSAGCSRLAAPQVGFDSCCNGVGVVTCRGWACRSASSLRCSCSPRSATPTCSSTWARACGRRSRCVLCRSWSRAAPCILSSTLRRCCRAPKRRPSSARCGNSFPPTSGSG